MGVKLDRCFSGGKEAEGVSEHGVEENIWNFHSLSRGDFPSRWLQPLQCLLVSPLGVPDRSRTVCYRTNAVHELPSPPVHLL